MVLSFGISVLGSQLLSVRGDRWTRRRGDIDMTKTEAGREKHHTHTYTPPPQGDTDK